MCFQLFMGYSSNRFQHWSFFTQLRLYKLVFNRTYLKLKFSQRICLKLLSVMLFSWSSGKWVKVPFLEKKRSLWWIKIEVYNSYHNSPIQPRSLGVLYQKIYIQNLPPSDTYLPPISEIKLAWSFTGSSLKTWSVIDCFAVSLHSPNGRQFACR